MLSAGGKGSGSDWIAVPTSWNDWWDEAEFVTATRLRLASLRTPVDTPCRLVNKSTEEPCGHLMRGIVTHLPGLSVWSSASESTHCNETNVGC